MGLCVGGISIKCFDQRRFDWAFGCFDTIDHALELKSYRTGEQHTVTICDSPNRETDSTANRKNLCLQTMVDGGKNLRTRRMV